MSEDDAAIDCVENANAAPYVLGALEQEECSAFREHLSSCPSCRAEVAELQLVADALPESVAPALAPAQLRTRVMASVRSEAELLHAAGSQADRPEKPASRWRSRRFSLLTAGAALSAAAAVVVVIALGIGGSTSERVTPGTAPAGAEAALHQVGNHADLIVERMPQPPLGRIYEVWLKRGAGGAAQPTDALFSVTSRGSAAVHVPSSLRGVTQVMVTSEPDGGSLHPTTKPLITVSL